MDSETHDFYLRVAGSLAGCQLVEQELKPYITEALQLVRKCVGGSLPFKMSGEDYMDSSLERLIQIFRKLSANDELVAALVRFKDERNFLSHNAIANCLDLEGELLLSSAAQMQDRLTAIQSEAQRLTSALHLEANKFRADLYFDPIV